MNLSLSEKLRLETSNKARKREIREIIETLFPSKGSNSTSDSEQMEEPTVAVDA